MERYLSSEGFKPIEGIPQNAPEHVRRTIAEYNQQVGSDVRLTYQMAALERDIKRVGNESGAP